MFNRNWWMASLSALITTSSLHGVDVLLEMKAAYFLPTNSHFKAIFDDGGVMFGPELTVQCGQNSHWYGFASVDYFGRIGCAQCLPAPVGIEIWTGALGVKYFFPRIRNCLDFYLGLGVEPIYAEVTNCSPYVQESQNKWTCGGIAKVGAYVRLPWNFFFDFFVDYTAANLSSSCDENCACYTVPTDFYIGGFLFGGALGYRF